MIFGYPSQAITDNWLHECLVETIQAIHNSILCGIELPEWPAFLPEDFRDILQSRTGFHDRLISYYDAASTLPHEEINRIGDVLIQQNQIEELLSATCNCETITDLPERIRAPIKSLFEFAFKKLSDLGLRDQQYQVIYNSTTDICPFCGCEYFNAPGGIREALDHYLPDSKYPLAGANLQNLVPMGHKCNSSYKHTQDVLFGEDGSRRRNFYPYSDNHTGIRITLDGSIPFEGEQLPIPLPRWQFDFDPNTEEVTTWQSIFHIQERYERDILNPKFRSWLGFFSNWYKHSGHNIANEDGIVPILEHYIAYLESMGINDRAFLKAAVFRMLLHHCTRGNHRLIDFLTDLVGAN